MPRMRGVAAGYVPTATPITRTPAGGKVSVCVGRVRLHRRVPPGASAGDAKRLEAELTIAVDAPLQARARRSSMWIATPGERLGEREGR
jgi:hypothetical protein